MKKTIILFHANEKTLIQQFLIMLEACLDTDEIEELSFENKDIGNISKYLNDTHIDKIISVDFAGFEMSTLLESYLYNILPAKQLHFVTGTSTTNYLINRELALNLYLAIPEQNCSEVHIENRRFVPNSIITPAYECKNGVIISSDRNQMLIQNIIDIFDKETAM